MGGIETTGAEHMVPEAHVPQQIVVYPKLAPLSVRNGAVFPAVRHFRRLIYFAVPGDKIDMPS